MLHAITRQARAVDARVASINASRAAETPAKPPISTAYFFDHFAEEADTAVVVTEQDFVTAKGELVPSVSVDELRHYERVRRTFEESGKEGKGGDKGQGAEARQGAAPTPGLKISAASPPLQQPSAVSNGKGKGKAAAVPDAVSTQQPSNGGIIHNVREVSADDDDDDEDEYVIRTDHLINGSAATAASAEGGANGKGKGKGKGTATTTYDGGGFGDATEGDEEMYA